MRVVKIGIIGMGGRGVGFLRSYNKDPHPGFLLSAVCDLSEERLVQIRADFGEGFSCYTDMHEMLRESDVDAVIVATNDPDHVEPVIAALRAGKHVMAEKPLCQTVEDAVRIAEEQRKAEGIFMMGFELREVSVFKEMKKFIGEGRIGNIKVAHVFDNVSVGGLYFYHDPGKQKAFYRSLLLQKATHSLDLLNWLVGSNPVKVFGMGGLDVFGKQDDGPEVEDSLRCADCEKADSCPHYIADKKLVMDYGESVRTSDICVWNKEMDINDNSELCIMYANGVRATFQEIHFCPDYSREFWFVGTKGKMYGFYNNAGNFVIRIHKHTPAIEKADRERDVEEFHPQALPGGHGGGDPALRDEFYRCIIENVPPTDVMESAYYSTALAACAEESIESGLPVSIPQLASSHS